MLKINYLMRKEKERKENKEEKESCALKNLCLFGHFCRMGPLSLSKLVKMISRH